MAVKSHSIYFTKGVLFSEIFIFVSNLPKNEPHHYLEHYSPKEKMLRSLIWYIFWPKWKTFWYQATSNWHLLIEFVTQLHLGW